MRATADCVPHVSAQALFMNLKAADRSRVPQVRVRSLDANLGRWTLTLARLMNAQLARKRGEPGAPGIPLMRGCLNPTTVAERN